MEVGGNAVIGDDGLGTVTAKKITTAIALGYGPYNWPWG